MPHLADALRSGAGDVHAAEVILDLRRSLKPDLYGRLVDHSLLYTPYLPLFWYSEGNPRRPLTSMLLKDWENPEIFSRFTEYIYRSYDNQQAKNILAMIGK